MLRSGAGLARDSRCWRSRTVSRRSGSAVVAVVGHGRSWRARVHLLPRSGRWLHAPARARSLTVVTAWRTGVVYCGDGWTRVHGGRHGGSDALPRGGLGSVCRRAVGRSAALAGGVGRCARRGGSGVRRRRCRSKRCDEDFCAWVLGAQLPLAIVAVAGGRRRPSRARDKSGK